MASPVPEIEEVRGIVDRHFPVYEVRVQPQILSCFVRADPFTLEDDFEAMRKELMSRQYIPTITMEGGEHVVHVQRRPPARYRGVQVNVALLIITMITTTLAGMDNWAAYDGAPLWSLSTLGFGVLFFSLPLMTILGTHELGHYLMAKKHKVHASLPFFIPVPPFVSPLGTFGAFISMRDPIPNRKSLLDIGISGPVVGFLVALPIAVAGIWLSATTANPLPQNIGDEGAIAYQLPVLYQALVLFFPMPTDILFHPLAFAGWVGLFVTALNLLPAGQLDGGHVARALLGDNARYLSYGALLTMIFLGMVFQGWIIIALIILFLGARHPPPLNDITPLDGVRKGAGVMAAVIMLLCFVPFPAGLVLPSYDFEFHDLDDPADVLTEWNLTASPGTNVSYTFTVNNTGNSFIAVNLSTDIPRAMIHDGWNAWFQIEGGNASEVITVGLNSSEGAVVDLSILVPPGTPPGPYSLTVAGTLESGQGQGTSAEFLINVEVQ